jgi:hypothetical protein
MCVAHKVGNILLMMTYIEEHLLRKYEARADMDYYKGHPDPEILALTVDVQAVLMSPKLNASSLYYRTKLASHNYTTCDLHSNAATCSIWNESEGGMVASVFATCLLDVLLLDKITFRPAIKKIIIFSDGCGYQNRCSVLSNALLNFCKEHNIIVEHNILEKGHTQMPVDTCHSNIEQQIRDKFIYAPSDYLELMVQARPKQPFEVREYSYSDFRDYSKLAYICTIKPAEFNVTDIRCLRYTPNMELFYKLNYSDNWTIMPHKVSNGQYPIGKLYMQQIPIKNSKWTHLQELLHVIPQRYHFFL